MFDNESVFEERLIALLQTKGWEKDVLSSPSQTELIANWANILFDNNQGIDRLNGVRLTEGEMQQIMEQIADLRTPLKLNGFINGKSVSIKRDNPLDILHLGREISLKIYDRQEIAAGQSRYQIAQQVPLLRNMVLSHDRRSDLLLLINGMPVIHIELKRSGIPVSQAAYQIEKYAHEGLFTGLFSLIQIFVAMSPIEAVYFANPGPDGHFNRDYYFHWADFSNEPINEWYRIATSLLSIPMAHQLIGFYTVADKTDGILKVMRSYQYYAANAISVAVAKKDWSDQSQLGGYIWHTTGSGKTMTSFKSAQLIANSKDADKVVFLMDRIELGNQSLGEYRGFADESDDVQATENTQVLVSKLKSDEPTNTLIVTSIQKMSNIKAGEGAMNAHDIKRMNKKRIVFVVDECHRSTFGDMLSIIKDTFPGALFFGFTGTPVHEENKKLWSTTATIFGNELHRYSIADGIRDKNVLGFDPYKVLTFRDTDVRRALALEKCKAENESEAINNPKKSTIFYRYMDGNQIKMAGYKDDNGKYIKGIEDELPASQYLTEEHQRMVVQDIRENWDRLSHGGMFHALLATSSIPEAIAYYRLMKQELPSLKVSALFDISDIVEGVIYRGEWLIEILEDYNQRFQQAFDAGAHGKFKKDVSHRLAHKEQYRNIDRTPDQQLDLLIVVEQMLTGFDSKWLNTLYMDKLQKYEHIIQAFSRTNRLFGPEKPFGTIRYYRKPHTMERNVFEAVKLYSGDRPFGLFVQLLDANLQVMNRVYVEIATLFQRAGAPNMERLPEEPAVKGEFAKLFKQLNDHLEASKVQGFRWDTASYYFEEKDGQPDFSITMVFTQQDYLILAQRYKEMSSSGPGQGDGSVPYDIDGYLTQIDTGMIDANYMNSRFKKFLMELGQPGAQEALAELHKSFATLTQEEQRFANILIYDIQSGKASFAEGMTFRDIITLYQTRAKNTQVVRLIDLLGVDEIKLRRLLNAGVSEININEFGRFDELKASVNGEKARAHFEQTEGSTLSLFQVNIRIQNLLTKFVLQGGIDV